MDCMQGTGMVGVPGTASTLFSTVRDANVNVIMISQASSEHSICFAVKQIDADRTLHCLHERYVSVPTMSPHIVVVEVLLAFSQSLESSQRPLC